ncbi:MAG: hypothetical protein LBL65_02075 [Campylobacteraceae bacterium]|jgi:uncharacterized protein|nr:hypothetical protein [Campylobacteraceae bacterium]
MKKILLLLTISLTFLFPASFDCKKAKTDVEKLICSNEELSQLDEELNLLYEQARIITSNIGIEYNQKRDYDKPQEDKTIILHPNVKKTSIYKNQLSWLKERDNCKDEDCTKTLYINQAKSLNEIIEKYLLGINKAFDEAKVRFDKSKNVYISIELLDKANAVALLLVQPKGIDNETYARLLKEYGFYRANTAENQQEQFNLKLSEKTLKLSSAKNPNDADTFRYLGQVYQKLFKQTAYIGKVVAYSKDAYTMAYGYRFDIPYKAKQAYTNYARVAKEQNLTMDDLTHFEKSIIKRDYVFFIAYDEFAGIHNMWTYDTIKKDPDFPNVCKEYVELLNDSLPNDISIACERNVPENDKFKIFVADKYFYDFIYKEQLFSDTFQGLNKRDDIGETTKNFKNCKYYFWNTKKDFINRFPDGSSCGLLKSLQDGSFKPKMQIEPIEF